MNRSEALKNFRTVTKADLETMYTKELLKLLQSARVLAGQEWDYKKDEDWRFAIAEADKFSDLIKEVLVTREHVPNKVEAKAIRKAKVKQGK